MALWVIPATSADYINVGGKLVVIDVSSKGILGSIDLGGHPDSIPISPDGQYAANENENERNEDLNDGTLPQLPAGYHAKQVRLGFEGITEYNSRLYVAFQRAWAGDAQPMLGHFAKW